MISACLQLRDLVPPQSKESNSQDNLDPSKRPKHVVLSDTIQLVRVLQHKVRHSLRHNILTLSHEPLQEALPWQALHILSSTIRGTILPRPVYFMLGFGHRRKTTCACNHRCQSPRRR